MALVRIRNAGEEREEFMEPMVAKRVLHRIAASKDKQYEEMQAKLQADLKDIIDASIVKDKDFESRIKEKERLIYIISILTFLIGGGLGCLMS